MDTYACPFVSTNTDKTPKKVTKKQNFEGLRLFVLGCGAYLPERTTKKQNFEGKTSKMKRKDGKTLFCLFTCRGVIKPPNPFRQMPNTFR